MWNAIHVKTKVLPGNRVEVKTPGFGEGASVEVFVVQPEAPGLSRCSMLELLESLPAETRLFESAAQADHFLQEERDSWDR